MYPATCRDHGDEITTGCFHSQLAPNRLHLDIRTVEWSLAPDWFAPGSHIRFLLARAYEANRKRQTIPGDDHWRVTRMVITSFLM